MELALLIDKYLSDKAELRHEDDSFNIVNDSIFRWYFANIPQPTHEDLMALLPEVKAKTSQDAVNAEAEEFLKNSDWKVLRHIGQQALGLATSLTSQDYQELEQQRQMARETIIK